MFIDNRQNLCEHGGMNQIIELKGKYVPGKVYTSMKETFIKNWDYNSVFGFDSSKGIPKFTKHDI